VIFTELLFLPFFLVCFGVHWSLRNDTARKLWLLVCSYFFYACWDWRFLSLILLSTCIDYVAGRLIAESAERRAKLVLGISLAANLGILGFFKYFEFFVTSGSDLLTLLGFDVAPRTLEIILPVGISFFTFQSMSYSIDIYRRSLRPTTEPLDFALFVAFFPQLVAGPIVRAADFLPQLKASRVWSNVSARAALLLFLSGFFKKACMADNIGLAIEPVFADPAQFGAIDIPLAAILYAVQIYCDFSGYSDMAIGVAALLGYRLTKNFDFPYFSSNVQDFWRRWHISLSTWLRDYLYRSLGGGRGTTIRIFRNVMLTMLLGGLWHGANLTFIVWGGLHGLALVAHRLWQGVRNTIVPSTYRPAQSLAALAAVLSALATFAWVVACLALFRSQSLSDAAAFFSQMTQPDTASTLDMNWWALLGTLAAIHYVGFRFGDRIKATVLGWPRPVFAFVFGAAAALVPIFLRINSEPFIYFQF
jgi:alginate O-acetyltransferase complex protein AlgI